MTRMVNARDITSRVQVGSVDDEFLEIMRCVCGKKYGLWEFTLNIYPDSAKKCQNCGRLLYFSNEVRVFDITHDPDEEVKLGKDFSEQLDLMSRKRLKQFAINAMGIASTHPNMSAMTPQEVFEFIFNTGEEENTITVTFDESNTTAGE